MFADSWTVGAVNKHDITERDEVYELDVFFQWYYGDLRRGTYRVTYSIKTEKTEKKNLMDTFIQPFKSPSEDRVIKWLYYVTT